MASSATSQAPPPAAASSTIASHPAPITCHVLNTVTGQPAASIPVSLTLLRPFGPSTPLTSVTDANGRVTSWTLPDGGGPGLDEIFAHAAAAHVSDDGEAETAPSTMIWSLKFDAGAYFRGEGWWDIVEIRFKTEIGGSENRKHWHVPLLLSPYAYTTYRGS